MKKHKRPAVGHRVFKRAVNIGRRTSKREQSRKACRNWRKDP